MGQEKERVGGGVPRGPDGGVAEGRGRDLGIARSGWQLPALEHECKTYATDPAAHRLHLVDLNSDKWRKACNVTTRSEGEA